MDLPEDLGSILQILIDRQQLGDAGKSPFAIMRLQGMFGTGKRESLAVGVFAVFCPNQSSVLPYRMTGPGRGLLARGAPVLHLAEDPPSRRALISVGWDRAGHRMGISARTNPGDLEADSVIDDLRYR